MTRALATEHRPQVAPDRGCAYAPRCTTCPWLTCIKELPAAQRGEFTTALRVVLTYAAAPERALG